MIGTRPTEERVTRLCGSRRGGNGSRGVGSRGLDGAEWAGRQADQTTATSAGFDDRQVTALELHDRARLAHPPRAANSAGVTQARFDA